MSVNVYDPNTGLKQIAGVPIDSITDLEKTSIVVYCDTPSNVAAKVGTAHNFVFRPLSKFYICFKYENTAESEITLNINGVGARAVIINGTISSATNYSIPAGIYECVYDNTEGTTYGEYYISTNYFNAISPANEVVHFTSSDTTDANATSWTSVNTLYGYENNKTFFERISQMFKNVRYLYKMLGTTDISSIGNGTVTDGISTLNSALTQTSTSLAQALITLASCPNFQFYPITNGYRIIMARSGNGSIQFDFGTSGSIANRFYVTVKDGDSNVVFTHYVTMT